MESELPMIQLPPKTLQRVEKLQIYAILSGEKGEALEAVKNKLVLSVVIAYNDSEAILVARNLLVAAGRKSEEYATPFMIVKGEVEKMVPDIDKYLIPNLAGGEVEATPNKIVEYVARVFETVGTTSQKKVATAVIEKYQKHVKFIPRNPFEAS